ncbi:hypothetical protein TKK_0013126 [Trichogramma kaykai]
MVFEFCDRDLAGLLSNEEIEFERAEIKMIVEMLCDALHYIHANNVVHRDSKPANILMTIRDGVLKLADFGLIGHDVVQSAGTILLGERCYSGKKVDMWTLGRALDTRASAAGRERDAAAESRNSSLRLHRRGRLAREVKSLPLSKTIEPRKGLERTVLPELSLFIEDRSCLDLIDRLLVLNPKKRLDADQVYKHDYFFTEPWPCELKNLMQTITTSNFEKTNA